MSAPSLEPFLSGFVKAVLLCLVVPPELEPELEEEEEAHRPSLGEVEVGEGEGEACSF